ncbi:MAG: accessory Sec system translocase SecA2 [Myxococcales bacterium]|nr:accessory Sec system translocase SecA2 [Myxococcales bacterium]
MSPMKPRLQAFLQRLRGIPIETDLKPYRKDLVFVRRRRDEMRREDDDSLRALAAELKRRARAGEDENGLLIDTFALAGEAARRTIGLEPFDEQILAGLAMSRGRLAEMQTGEGKTLAAVLPAAWRAFSGAGVHVLTHNDYLARRDARWMGPIYRFLGLAVGVIQEGMTAADRRHAYRCDITYVTAREAGFDYLRDQLVFSPAETAHRELHFAIVDEADSLLIDDARVPLVIAGARGARPASARRMAELVGELRRGEDYDLDEYGRNVFFTEAGLDRAESALGAGRLHDPPNQALLTELNLALHAAVLLRRDVDYLVREGRIELVDEFTGRVAQNRQWPDGLQAALEAKEGLDPRPDGSILGSITLLHFLRLYPCLAGMTATAQPAAEELKQFYDLAVAVIPPHRLCIRRDLPDRVFTHREAKLAALTAEIRGVQASGRPVLVGTTSVKESEELATTLRQAGVACRVLNAKNDEREAEIIAGAGALGAVTISTNMAGRGTDIRLGGADGSDGERVTALGGLYVIGTNRHESRRIDDQLRGRAGRQGDPGESRFFISLEDDLATRFGLEGLLPKKRRGWRRDEPLDDPVIAWRVAQLQRIIEGQNFAIRRTLWKYSMLVEEQRVEWQARRTEVLHGRFDSVLDEEPTREKFRALQPRVGESVLREAERRLTLFHLDELWREHLARIADLREGIHLARYGKQDPWMEFQKEIAAAFWELGDQAAERVRASFLQAKVTAAGIDLESEGLRRPSSTWTYLVNDDPFGDEIGRFFLGLKKAVVAAVTGK